MLMPSLAIIAGLALLVWSADRFVEGAAATARYAGMPPLLIGMVVVGFGTSAPEMVVSALAALEGKPALALGNAYGSNITNIALILGLVALISPIAVHSQVIRKELPILGAITLFSGVLIFDDLLTRLDAVLLLGVFAGLMIWSIRQGMAQSNDALGSDMAAELQDHAMSRQAALMWLFVGLILLIASSRLLVWGAVSIAQSMGVSELIIGLTIVAVGTSLPELASSLMAIRKKEHDIALGNVIGSNLFNTLAVVGIAAIIHPLEVPAEVQTRDWGLMTLLTFSLFIIGMGFGGRAPRVNRLEGALYLLVFVLYTAYLAKTAFTA
ncbi:MAG: calcium/sodium antiporter [Hahellaceae bacterium]|nr:calcium/sodium antiporter [Hahellaceae bacterium]